MTNYFSVRPFQAQGHVLIASLTWGAEMPRERCQRTWFHKHIYTSTSDLTRLADRKPGFPTIFSNNIDNWRQILNFTGYQINTCIASCLLFFYKTYHYAPYIAPYGEIGCWLIDLIDWLIDWFVYFIFIYYYWYSFIYSINDLSISLIDWLNPSMWSVTE